MARVLSDFSTKSAGAKEVLAGGAVYGALGAGVALVATTGYAGVQAFRGKLSLKRTARFYVSSMAAGSVSVAAFGTFIRRRATRDL